MTFPLAKLDDLKKRTNTVASDVHDAELTDLLQRATDAASTLAGWPLPRAVDVVETPANYHAQAQLLTLRRQHIESVSEVVAVWGAASGAGASDAEFDAADPLAVNDYAVTAMGTLARLGGWCWPLGHRNTRVTYTAGFANPTPGSELPTPEAQHPPGDLQQAIVLQAAKWWAERGDTPTPPGKGDAMAPYIPELMHAAKALRGVSL